MQPDPRFRAAPPEFWANVKLISQRAGYTVRSIGTIKRHDVAAITKAYDQLGLSTEHLFSGSGRRTELGQLLLDYFEYRANILEGHAEPSLMDFEVAREEFLELQRRVKPKRPFATNKQKGEKAGPAIFTSIINMIVEAEVGDDCDFNPQALTTVTFDGLPVRTLSRRVDGAYPSTVNPIALWEIKEYYWTTTFGSRVADGVYETLLDGLELDELSIAADIHIRHILMIDSHRTWWKMGRPYLCRMVDIMNMGYVDEVLCGREVLDRLPQLIREWVALRERGQFLGDFEG